MVFVKRLGAHQCSSRCGSAQALNTIYSTGKSIGGTTTRWMTPPERHPRVREGAQCASGLDPQLQPSLEVERQLIPRLEAP